MKTASKIALAVYLFILLWLVLFKFSFDIASVLLDHQARSLSLVPFTDFSKSEMISNFIVFIPFGLLLGVTFKRITFWQKLACIFVFSLAVEAIQFVLAIGVTDITDVITNTLGGLLGLTLYELGNKYIDTEKQDRFIIIVGAILIIAFLFLRFMVFKVRY